jgi:hypothetical protein
MASAYLRKIQSATVVVNVIFWHRQYTPKFTIQQQYEIYLIRWRAWPWIES